MTDGTNKYRYVGPASVTYRAAADGQARLKAWADESAIRRDGVVWLTDLSAPERHARLLLPDAAVRDAGNWRGQTFSGGVELLEMTAEADAPENAYAVVAEKLFGRFGCLGESADYPIHVSRTVSGTIRKMMFSGGHTFVAQLENGQQRHGRVLVQSVDGSGIERASADGRVAIECLTLTVTAADGRKAANWKAV